MPGKKQKYREWIVALLSSLLCELNIYCHGTENNIFLYKQRLKEFKLLKIPEPERGSSPRSGYMRSGYKENFETMKEYKGVHGDIGVIDYSRMTFSHAESPVWDPDSQTLYWVDVLDHTVHALEFLSLKHKARRIDYGEVNVVIPVAGSEALLIGSLAKVFLMHWDRPELTLISSLEPDRPYNILNEGKCDAFGRLWAGTKGPQIGDDVEPRQAGLYKLEGPCYEPRLRLHNVTISNGMTWALNNSLLYYIDSITHKVEVFDYDLQKGRLAKCGFVVVENRRSVLDTSQWGFTNPIPDGMTIDRDGMLWVALFFYGTILRIDPDRRIILREYQLPVSRVTSMAWAGSNMEDLVITTSRRNVDTYALNWHPLSGTIFVLRALGTGGVPDHKFQYHNTTCHYNKLQSHIVYT